MSIKVLREEKSISKINWFFLGTISWSILVQFLPLPSNFYQYVAFLIPIIIYLSFNKSNAERILKPDPLSLKSMFIIFFIWLSSLPLLVFLVELYVHFFGNVLADMVSQDSHEVFIINFFFVAVTPAILEEILMRGIILDGYRNKSRIVAAIMNGLMFGILHLNSFQFFHTFVAGFIASILVFATNSIFAGMFIHVINNGLPLIINYLYPIDPNMAYVEDTNFLSLGIFALIGIIVGIKLINLLFKINNRTMMEDKRPSDERIFTLPLFLSIIIFIGFSMLIILSI